MAFTTQHSILQRLRTGDEVGWEEFLATYQPLIRCRGQARGLWPAELDDLVQDVMLSVFEGQQRPFYDPAKGRFRDFLGRIIDRRAVDLLRRRKPNTGPQESGADEVPSPDWDERVEAWEKAWQEHLLVEALAVLRESVAPAHYRVFYQAAVEGRDPAAVAAAAGLTVTNVYLIKHRLLKQLKQAVRLLEDVS